MICTICGKDSAERLDSNGNAAHDWCRDAVDLARIEIIRYFTSSQMLISSDAVDKILAYPKLALDSKWLYRTMRNTAINFNKQTARGYVNADDVAIEIELSFSTI